MKQQEEMTAPPDKNAPERPASAALCCLRCGSAMRSVDTERYAAGNLLLKQIQKIISGAGIHVYHCPGCGKIELYK